MTETRDDLEVILDALLAALEHENKERLITSAHTRRVRRLALLEQTRARAASSSLRSARDHIARALAHALLEELEEAKHQGRCAALELRDALTLSAPSLAPRAAA